MTTIDPVLIAQVRDVSRHLVREFGFMKPTLAATALPPSAVHTLLEIDLNGPQTAAQLSEKLNLDKSSVSRMLKKLLDAGELEEKPDSADARMKWLHLSIKGQQTVQRAHAFGQVQTERALQRLSEQERQSVLQGIASYANALQSNRTGKSGMPFVKPAVEIQAGYIPGAIGRIACLFATHFARDYGFGQYFEGKVASELAEFTRRLDKPCNGLWLAQRAGQVLGSVAIDGEDLGGNTAHLRWFILDESLRGQGTGRRLLQSAVDFCDQRGFAEIHLWTVRGLDVARRLYDEVGFTLAEELLATQWGKETVEQRLVRMLRPLP